MNIKFEKYRDRTWYLFLSAALILKSGCLLMGRTQLDLVIKRVLNPTWPVFLKAIVFLHMAPYVFQHRVIPGQTGNLHLPSEVFLSVRKKILWGVGKKLLKDELANFSNRPKTYVTPPLIHSIRILPAYLSPSVYSDINNPGVLYQRTYDITVRGFIKAREGFMMGAYQLAEAFLKRPVMIVTDQKPYKIQQEDTKITRWNRLFGFLKPFWPAGKQLAAAMTYLMGFVGVFGGIFLSLDLSFLEPLWAVIVNVFSQIPLVGPIFGAIFHAITTSYFS
jgi:hypothetical protein